MIPEVEIPHFSDALLSIASRIFPISDSRSFVTLSRLELNEFVCK